MCIRDSIAIDRAAFLIRPAQHRVALRVDVNLAAERVMVHPVSYTHLRAHETVLDLVCRLLLEKKKTGKALNLPIPHHTVHMPPPTHPQ